MAKRCPTCKSSLSPPFIACDYCSWTASTHPAKRQPQTYDDVDRLRWSWISNGERCRYMGTIGETPRGQDNKVGPMFCRGHFGCNDPVFGQIVVDESKAVVPATMSYSAEAVLQGIRTRGNTNAATPNELEDQQWYNVCKYFPQVAAHCKRPRFEVGPDHPLDATSHRGPLMRQLAPAIPRRGNDPDAIAEREAIQSERP